MSNLPFAINGFLQAIVEGQSAQSVDRFRKSCIAGEFALRQLFANDPENPVNTFITYWDEFSDGMLSALENWDNILAAGGAVEACLSLPQVPVLSKKELRKIFQTPAYQKSDIDLFIWGLDEDQAKKKMQEIFDIINSSLSWDAVCFRTKNTITIQANFPKRQVEIVMRLYRSPAEILCGFDVDSCCFAFNGTNVFTNPRGLSAIVRQCNTIDFSRRSPSYEHRLAKYSNRGYEIFYPGLERSRINYERLADPDRNAFPKGLGRLIVYEIMALGHENFPRLYEGCDELIRPAPLSVETLRPSSYDYAWCRLPYGPKWWDVQDVKVHVDKVAQGIIEELSRTRNEGALIHRHVMTSGTMERCLEQCCDFYNMAGSMRERPLVQNLASGLFRGPATFMCDNPGRQLIGSFNFTTHEDWEVDAYFGDGDDDDDTSDDSEATIFDYD